MTVDELAAGPVPGLEGVAELIGSTVVDGVPVLHAPTDGLVTGALLFRVGRADEPLASAGITHLVEHLALFRQNMTDVHHNGQTAPTYTVFHATGTVAEVVEFLNGVCASLCDLPLARLATEKEILRTEAARREFGPASLQRVWRYGARGHGTVAYDEAGLGRLTADDVREWAARWFTRDNAACFLTTDEVPAGLDLGLPAGSREHLAPTPETLPTKPAWFVGRRGGVLLDAVVPRSTAAAIFTRVAQRVLFRELRQEGGWSYEVNTDYEPVDADRARITLFADALEDKEDAVVGALVDALAAMRCGNIAVADLEAARKLAQQEMTVPHLGAALLPACALNLLVGHPTQSPEALRAEQDAVTVADLAAVASAVWDDALAQVPRAGLDWAGFTAAPGWSADEVEGTRRARIEDGDQTLVIGAAGVSLRQPAGVVTVRFDECALLQVVPDGARILTGYDGMRIAIEPNLYQGLDRTVVERDIDPHVPPERVVRMPARREEDIPQRPPGIAAGDAVPAPAPEARGALRTALGIALVVTGVAATLGMIVVVAALRSLVTGNPGMSIGLFAVLAAVEAVLVLVTATVARVRERMGARGSTT